MNWQLATLVTVPTVDTLGFLVGAFVWRRVRNQRLMVFWLGLSAITDWAFLIAARTSGNSRPVVRVWYAASVVAALAAMAAYQGSPRRAKLLWGASAAYVVLWTILLLTIEPIAEYSSYSAPIHALLILAAAVMTLFRRVAVARGDLVRDAGFLFAAGLIVYAVPATIQALVPQVMGLGGASAYYALTDVISFMGTALIVAGLLVSSSSTVRRPA